MDETREIDWLAIERDFCAGVRSNRDLATQYGISETAIRKRAKRDGWVKDLSGKIRAKAEELVRIEAVRSEVRNSLKSTESETVAVNARMQADVILSHRSDIQRHRSLCTKLLLELEEQTNDPLTFAELCNSLLEIDGAKRSAAIDKVLSSPQRIKSVRELSETLKTLIGLERQAFGISDNSNGDADKSETVTRIELVPLS